MADFPLNITPRDLDIAYYAYRHLPEDLRGAYLYTYLFSLSQCGEDVYGRSCYTSTDPLSRQRSDLSGRDMTRMSWELVRCLEGRNTSPQTLRDNMNTCAAVVNAEETRTFSEFPHRPYEEAPQVVFSASDELPPEDQRRLGAAYSSRVPATYTSPPMIDPAAQNFVRQITQVAQRHRTTLYEDTLANQRSWGRDGWSLRQGNDDLLSPITSRNFRHLEYFFRTYMRFHEVRTDGGLNRVESAARPVLAFPEPLIQNRRSSFVEFEPVVLDMQFTSPQLQGMGLALTMGVDVNAQLFGRALPRRTPLQILSLPLNEQLNPRRATHVQMNLLAGYRGLIAAGDIAGISSPTLSHQVRLGLGLNYALQNFEDFYPVQSHSLRGVVTLFPEDFSRLRATAEWTSHFSIGQRGWFWSLNVGLGADFSTAGVGLVGQAGLGFGIRYGGSR